MSTSTVNLSTAGLSSVTEDIRVALFLASDEAAVVDDIIEDTLPHNNRTWTFFGVENGENYICKVQKLIAPDVWEDIQGQYFTFSAGSNEINAKMSQNIQAGVTAGFAAGVNSVTFADWIGWEIIPHRGMTTILVKGTDYTYDIETGTMVLITVDDVFNNNEWWHIAFEEKVATAGNSSAYGRPFSSLKLITANAAIAANDFGRRALIKGAGSYLEALLPEILTVPINKVLWVESGIGNHITAALKTINGNVIDWKFGNRSAMYICRCEGFGIYREKIDDVTNVWRIIDADGNFKTVGRKFWSSSDSVDELNAIPLDGGGVDGLHFQDYARLYNDHVLLQAPGNLTTYDDWPTGTNKYKFSLKNADGLFRIPDTRGKFIRNASATREPGVWQDHALLAHQHIAQPGGLNHLNGGGYGQTTSDFVIGTFNGQQTSKRDITSQPSSNNGTLLTNVDTETRPENVSDRQFVNI